MVQCPAITKIPGAIASSFSKCCPRLECLSTLKERVSNFATRDFYALKKVKKDGKGYTWEIHTESNNKDVIVSGLSPQNFESVGLFSVFKFLGVISSLYIPFSIRGDIQVQSLEDTGELNKGWSYTKNIVTGDITLAETDRVEKGWVWDTTIPAKPVFTIPGSFNTEGVKEIHKYAAVAMPRKLFWGVAALGLAILSNYSNSYWTPAVTGLSLVSMPLVNRKIVTL